MRDYLHEAFKSMNSDDILNEEAFALDSKGADELKQFLDGDKVDDKATLIDPNAKSIEELKSSYRGNLVLDCCICHTGIIKPKEEVYIEDGDDVANIEDICPFCSGMGGYKIVGEVTDDYDSDEDEKDEKDDSDEKDGSDGEDEVEVEETEEEEKIEEGLSSEKKIEEAPNYELHPQYDSRKSFYGKARVDTGSKDDKNKLFSYDTLVAEIKDGKPVVYGAFSATTLRHIKDWLKQNGFKAENKAQILRDYGVKAEEKKCEGDKCEGKCRKHDIKRIEEGWRGSEEIEMIWHGSTADPELEYKGSRFNYWDIEDALWDMFLEETGHKDSEANDAEVEKEFNEYISNHATDYLDDLIASMDEGKECVTESVEEVSVKTDKEDISVRTDEDGKVSVETSVREETDEGAEEIAPVSDEVKAEIEDDSEEAEIGDEIDVEMTDFDEESFDELGEAYLKKAYSNVESYKSVSATANDNRITVEGVIKFKSGNEKKTKFVLESKEVTKSGKSRFVGENLQIAKGKKAFTVFGTLSEGRFVTESLGYDYRAKDKNGKSKRISGTVTKR